MHDSVTATFGGRSLTFKIDRQDLPLFEAYAGIPAIRSRPGGTPSCR